VKQRILHLRLEVRAIINMRANIEMLNCLNVQALFGQEDEGHDDDTANTSVTIYAHMLVVKACSPLLAALCEGYSKSSPVPINNAEPGIFRYMIRYVYGGTIPPSEFRKRPDVFIEIADRYGIKDLKMEAEAWYVKSDLIMGRTLLMSSHLLIV